MAAPTARQYDQAYFDKWYRSERHRVKSAEELRRQARFVLAASDFILGRPTRTVLDVGAGEGQWRGELRRMRPRIRYWGVDASEYAVRRFGRRRDLQLGSVVALDALTLPTRVDLVLCVGVLNYLTPADFRRALAQMHARTGGVAYLEIFSAEDAVEGDFTPRDARPARWYRRALGAAGFVSAGLHCYVPRERREAMAALELGG